VAHYTDWIVAHVHVGALGWNGMLTFGVLYWIIPRIFRTELYSKKMANNHFWLSTLGILFWAIPMYWAGFTQSSMWKQFTEAGQLKYTFLETVTYLKPFYAMRSLGGTLYLIGALIMVYNLYKTVKAGKLVADEAAEAAPLEKAYVSHGNEHWHRVIERRPVQLMILSLIVILIGGAIEIIPTFMVKSNVPTISSVKPYTPLELQGRDIYLREGCYTCHSQMIRPFRSETERYGEYSKAGEFVYDHPFQWGSKRTGPDLAREGAGNLKKTNGWHFRHFREPSSLSNGSIMPAYAFMLKANLDTSTTKAKINAMRTLGVPYEKGFENVANDSLMAQARGIAENLTTEDIKVSPNKEVIALIAYIQRLGTDISNQPSKK
jgi:cytochrome c oxidase cbb3-type subunit I/II